MVSQPEARPEAASALESMAGPHEVDWLISSHLKWTAALRKAVIEERWQEATQLGAQCLGLGYAGFRLLQAEESLAAQRRGREERAGRALADVLRRAAASRQRADFFGELRRRLAEGRPDRPSSWEESLQQLERGRKRNVPLLQELAKPLSATFDQRLGQVEDATIVALSRGLLGVLHGEFNQTFRDGRLKAESVSQIDVTGALGAMVEEFGAGLRAAQHHLYATLVTKPPPSEAAGPAALLAGLVEERLPRLARAQAQAALATRVLRRQGKGGAAEGLGRLAMEAGALTRQAVASHAASYRLALELLGPEPGDEVRYLYEKASTLPFEGPVPRGKSTTLAKLEAARDGSFIQVEGFVTALQVLRSSAGTLLARMELIDPSSKARGHAVAVYTHLPHRGVTKGVYCRLDGTYRKESALFEGKPAIAIDQLSLDKLTRESWRIAFLDSAARWFPCWPNGINLAWSLGPHRRARKDGEVSYHGAGDLIYPPFVHK